VAYNRILTNKRIIIKTGTLSKLTSEVLLQKVEGIGVMQSLMGRLFDYGTITVTDTEGAKQRLAGIQKPVEFQGMVQEQIEALPAELRKQERRQRKQLGIEG